jgi:hypothetical protein
MGTAQGTKLLDSNLEDKIHLSLKGGTGKDFRGKRDKFK